MGLSRLENLLKSVKGTTLHVNNDSLDATDSIENLGSSLTRPFKSIQRAIVEAVRYGYRSGLSNDEFAKTTIVVHPSTYIIDNRPGVVIRDNGTLVYRSGQTATLPEWSLPTNFNLYDQNNELYKLNSISGGVIVPRGITIWAYDLRKTIIRPLYVPNPENSNIERSSIFRLTSATLPEGLTYFDADPNGFCYKDYTTNKFVPNFSHHKLACSRYADGVNKVAINDQFITVNTNRTDLQMYYEKIARVYGNSSGRGIVDPVYSTGVSVDLEPIVDEYRIVGSKGKQVGITSIRAGNGVSATNTITVTLDSSSNDLSIDTPIQISNVGISGYDGMFVVSAVNSTTQVQYKSNIVPSNPLPSVVGATLNVVVDTVTSASPYIKKSTLRSVYGMCGFEADGNLVDGFKSSVISEFTGVSVQKDNNAFVKYDPISGTYKDSTTLPNLYKDSDARYKPDYEHYHLRLTNDAFSEVVETFAIGFAKQFNVESGADISINASKSDFGAKAFVADGFKKQAFSQDDQGFIVGVVPPKRISSNTLNVEFSSIDAQRTLAVGDSTRLYLSDQTNFNVLPNYNIDGYRIGAKTNEVLNLEISNGTTVGIHTAAVVIPGTTTSNSKVYSVERINGNTQNSITNNIITLTSNHNLITGEKVRALSSNGHLPDGLTPHKVGFAITTGLDANKLKIADTYNDALANNALTLNRKGGNLSVVSRVSDKLPGEIGHPIQWDAANNNWYINVVSNNAIYNQISTLGTGVIGKNTTRSFIERVIDNRNDEDRIVKLRYVIPSNTSLPARPPLDSYIIQESNDAALNSNELTKYFSESLTTILTADELKNPHYISDVKWSSNEATIISDVPHNLSVDSKVQIVNVIDGTYTVTQIVSPSQFKVALATNPGAFNKDTTARNQNLPYFKRLETSTVYQVYKVNQLQEYIFNKQDGIYDLIVVNSSNSPTVAPFTDLKFSQPIDNLYPQLNRDNPVSDPSPSVCFALPDRLGEVVLDDEQNSITKETYNKFLTDFNIGSNVTQILSNQVGTAHTIYTENSHSYNGMLSVTITNSGSNYVPGTYYGVDFVTTTGVGRNAKAKIVVDNTGVVSSLKIMDGGCAYVVGNTATLIPAAGFGTTTGFTPATVSVTKINDSTNESVLISGNSIPYRVTGITTHNQIQVASAIPNATNPIGYMVPSGKCSAISSFSYTATSGIATIGFSATHGFSSNERIRLGGFDYSYFNQEVKVDSVPNISTIIVNLGTGGTAIPTTGTRFAYPLNVYEDGKLVYYYAGITTSISDTLLDSDTTDVIVIPNASTSGLKLGDYIKVNDEVLRIKADVFSNNVSVLRSQLGSRKQSHVANSVVKKIAEIPIEFRRNSIIRASAHTLESVGFGPGNYSTALPERQTRKLSKREKNYAHSFKTNGGVVYYSANDENGDTYNTNKKINTSTGIEEVYETPVNNNVGEDKNYEIIRTSDVNINRSLRVTGGIDNAAVSEFDGPIVIHNKMTSYSPKGIEASQFFIQGDEKVSRRVGIGATTANVIGGYGDIIFNSYPKSGGFVGWVYTVDNRWCGFGTIA